MTCVSSIILGTEDQVKRIALWNMHGITLMYGLANVER